jgi:hypothetical protein
MPGLTRTTADAVLKEFYLPGVRGLLNEKVFLLSQVEANSEDVEGRRAVLAINTDRNQGIGARSENDVAGLPTAGQQGYSEERVTLKYNYGRIQLSGPVIASMGSDRGSFTRALDSETKGVTRDLKNDVNRQLYGTSNGIIAQAASNAGQVITLTTPTATQLRQLQVGMAVDVGTVAAPTTHGTAVVITAVNAAAGTITVSGTLGTVAATDFIFRASSGGTAPQKECTGLQTQVDNTAALWNIDPAVKPNWASYVDDPGGAARAVAEDMFIKAQQYVNIASGEEINLWITDPDVHRSVSKLLTSLKRFPTSTVLHGGYSGLDMSSVAQGNDGSTTVSMYFDKDCPTGKAFGLCTKRFQWYRMSDWEFMDQDGAVLNRVPNTDAYEATLYIYAELATDGRNAHARLGTIQ